MSLGGIIDKIMTFLENLDLKNITKEAEIMLFGKSINRYYLRFLHLFILGTLSLVMVDYAQLEIPELYRYLINGINTGFVEIDGQALAFNFQFVLDYICQPMMFIILAMVAALIRPVFSGVRSQWSRITSERVKRVSESTYSAMARPDSLG